MLPFKAALITKYHLIPILQPYIIQGYFIDFCDSLTFSKLCTPFELCLFCLFENLSTTIKASEI